MPRLSTRKLLVAVAVTALWITFPIDALISVVMTFLVMVLPPIILILIVDSRGYRRTSLAFALVITGIVSYNRPGFSPVPLHTNRVFFSWFTAVLTPINLAGPLVVVRHYWRDDRLTSGQILWAWMGLVWFVMLGPSILIYPTDVHVRVDWLFRLLMMEQFARLTSVIVLLTALYGKRPSPPDPAWAHRIGWAVAECDAIAWGWYAGGILRL